MSRQASTKTSFGAGELDPHLAGRLDLKAQDQGARTLRNVVVEPTGGVHRRPGLAWIATVADARRLVSVDGSQGPALFVFAPFSLRVFENAVQTAQLVTPFGPSHLDGIAMTRWGDRLLVSHPLVQPQEILPDPVSRWRIRSWSWETGTAVGTYTPSLIPFAKFARPEAVLQVDGSQIASDGTIKPETAVQLTCSEAYFQPLHAGITLRLALTDANGVRSSVDITLDPIPGDNLRARGTIHGKLVNGLRTRLWQEQAFSDLRGWPAALAVYQDRLVIGGSRDLPDRLWLSKTGHPFNVDLGTGLDDEAIAFRLGGDRIHEIRSLVAARHLEVFTSVGEWIVSGDPLTPGQVQAQLQTRVGSWTQHRIQPVDVDGATLFIAGNGRELREYLFADTEQAYQAADIALLARHLLDDPQDMAFDGKRRLFLVVRGDGALASVTIDRNNDVDAWSLQVSATRFRAVAVHAGETHFLVDLNGTVHLARFDDSLQLDLAVARTLPAPGRLVDGLARLEGREVLIVAADGTVTRSTVSAGAVMLAEPTATATAGLPYTSEIEPMPLQAATPAGVVLDQPYRPVRVVFRLLESALLRVDLGFGPQLLRSGPGPGGDVAVRAYGWRRGMNAVPWRVVQDDPLPLTLLSVTTDIRVND